MREPVIYIDSQKARELDIIQEWLERQLLHLIHKPRPRYIPCARNKIYKYALTCVDVASRTKWVCPLTERDSGSVAKGFIKLFKFYNFPLTRLETLQTDYGPEFYGKCEELMIKYNVKINRSKSKKRQGIVERFNRTLQEWAFFIQDAVELLLPPIERCRAWVTDYMIWDFGIWDFGIWISNLGGRYITDLTIFLEKLDNTVTRLIDMPPAEARKLKHVYAMSSKPRYGPMGYDEVRLTYSDSVLYLLNPGELEGGRRRVTDMNWSPQIYHIKESLVQKNQPVLYWLEDIDGNRPKRSFVREELMIVRNIEYPPQKILRS
ncbi:hypothetical protein Glove_65g136 [Diversispora epigaea]|uniref:Integrase catalytic domain-containing protein n=1 Tax=Diversispora epigaea TaxID=1348612 RepID=A0A397JBU3_9GLOM|nr:hypothetical protein Glove_65g136 [Diversispora epigaea]